MRDPCPQTFISGPVVSVQALSEFNMIRAHDDQVAPHLHVPDQDASRGNEADHEALPHDVAFHLIGWSAATDGADGGAGDPGRPLHRQHAEPGRFRCVPQGHRWRVAADRQRAQGEPAEDDAEAYIRERMQRPQNGFVAVTTLRQ
jgi:hypothetical protein